VTPHFRNRQDYERDYEEDDEKLYIDLTTFYDGDDTEVRVTVAGPVLDLSAEDYYGEGYAFLSKGDVYDRNIGQQIAYLRALRDALYDAELHIVSKVKTIEEAAAQVNGCPTCEQERYDDEPDNDISISDFHGEFSNEHPYEPEYEPYDEPTEAPAQVNGCPTCGAAGFTGPCPYIPAPNIFTTNVSQELYR